MSLFFRPDFRRLLSVNRAIYFNPRTERKAAGTAPSTKIGVVETWARKPEAERPVRLHLWLQNRRLVFRTKIPDAVFAEKNPVLADKVTSRISQSMVRLWEMNVEILQAQRRLPQVAGSQLDEVAAAERVQQLNLEVRRQTACFSETVRCRKQGD